MKTTKKSEAPMVDINELEKRNFDKGLTLQETKVLFTELRALRARIEKLERGYDQLQGWTLAYSSGPRSLGYYDTYEEGMRAAKNQVRNLCISMMAEKEDSDGSCRGE